MLLPSLLLLTMAAPPQPLAVVRPTLRQYEDGPALAPTFSFGAGESVAVDFHVSGFQVAETKIDLACQIDALDPEGVKLVETFRKEIQTTVSAQDKDWLPIVRHSFVIPPLALPGAYRILISVEDKLAHTSAHAELPLPVRGHQVQLSDKLEAHAFRFLRGEDDQQAIQPAAYRPGDTVWGRFEIVGFKYGEKNRVDVEYGLAVLGPTGKTLYEQPRAAVEQDESFYPKKYLPGVLSLNLQKNIQPGPYTIVLKIHDAIGNQTDESKHEFRIEP
jgi:hypothetical protein